MFPHGALHLSRGSRIASGQLPSLRFARFDPALYASPTAAPPPAPRDVAFYRDPYSFYDAVHASAPAFFWENYGHWCFASFKDVNALLRDKRFGRQILHLMSREELGMAPPKAHTAAFDQTEKYSLLTLEPPTHTRLRMLVNRAFVSRHVEQLRPRIERLANELIDGFEADGGVELLRSFAAPVPAIVIAEMIGLPAEMAMQLVDWSNRMVAMYMFGVTYETELDANQASIEFMDYIRTVIAERRAPAARGPAHPHADRRSRRRKADRGRGDLDRHPAAQRRPRGDGPHHRQRGQSHPREWARPRKRCSPTTRRPRPPSRNAIRYDAPLHMFTRYALQDVTLENGLSFKQGDTIGLMLGRRQPRPIALRACQ